VRGESGIDERAAVELNEVDRVFRAGQSTRCLQQGLEILLLVAKVQDRSRGTAQVPSGGRGRRARSRRTAVPARGSDSYQAG
jgi:hypothetical protein